MIKLSEIIRVLEEYYPLAFQEDYDNSGLQVGDVNKEINSALITLDVTPEIVDEAIQNKCNLIISHHPLLFVPLKKLVYNNYTNQLLIKLIKNDIALYSLHTNLDNSHKGLNKYVAEKLELTDVKILAPKKQYLKKLVTFCPAEHSEKLREALFEAGAGHIGNYDKCSFNIEGTGTFRANEGTNPFLGEINKTYSGAEIRIETIYPSFLENKILKALFDNHPYEEIAYDIYLLDNKWNNVGAGIIGLFSNSYSEEQLLTKLKSIFRTSVIKHNKYTGRKIKQVALCTGAGVFLLDNAINSGADALITADIKYHSFIEANDKIFIADCGHYETEIFSKEIIKDILIKKIPNFALLLSKKEENPVKYFS